MEKNFCFFSIKLDFSTIFTEQPINFVFALKFLLKLTAASTFLRKPFIGLGYNLFLLFRFFPLNLDQSMKS